MTSSKMEDQEENIAVIDDLDVSSFENDLQEMPIKFDFELDDFQKRSIIRLKENKCVFVSAPTSSGKTVVALYAISQCILNKKRAFYTSPIKALSNQKYREFSDRFGDVGILTGDVTIKRDAPILIMTTEVLQSMLYKNDLALNDIGTVIFDEFHYISDKERGSVWEECIIRMPKNINMTLLSASMPNAKEIADWISKTKEIKTYVEIHEERPVPLKHIIYSNENLYTISQPNQPFDKKTYNTANLRSLLPFNNKDNRTIGYLSGLIWKLRENKLLPALIFDFSINQIEKKCDSLLNVVGINLCTISEKDKITEFFNRVIKRFPPEDRNLPQIKKMLKLLQCGIGIHHSGIMPILKETVEILSSEGLLKLIFCTSTIGMGLNLPVKTCVFMNMERYYNKKYNSLSPTEYQQMSGRAGRRGLDTNGTSVLCIGKKFPKEDYLYNLFCGELEKIKSQFQVSFKMVLNSLRDKNGMTINEIMRKSFLACSRNSQYSIWIEKKEKAKNKLKNLTPIENCKYSKSRNNEDIEDIECGAPIRTFAENCIQINEINSEIVNKYKGNLLRVITKGMLVLFIYRNTILIAFINDISYNTENKIEIENVSLFYSSNENEVQIPFDPYFENLHFLTFSIDQNFELMNSEAKEKILKEFNFNKSLNRYDDFIKTRNMKFNELSNLHHKLVLEIVNSPCFGCGSFSDHYKISLKAGAFREKIKNAEKILLDNERDTYECYLKMLKDMNYIDENDNGEFILCNKGIVANDIYGHEILSTELLFSDVFKHLMPNELAALCSCLVTQRIGKDDDSYDMPNDLSEKVAEMKEICLHVYEKMLSNSIPFDAEDFMALSVNSSCVKAVFEWANNKSFSEIMKHTQKIMEGQMVSVITKVYSLLKSFSAAAEKMGDEILVERFNVASDMIKRGIPFARSIYLD